MDQHALLNLSGQDRPGIVARMAEVLFEAGCNIQDSSMTRLRNQFTVMLLLRFSEPTTLAELTERLQALANELQLQLTLTATPGRPPPNQETDLGCIIHVLGADQPGIVFKVAQILQEEQGNVIDMFTRVMGSTNKPIYAMTIEADMHQPITSLKARLKKLADDLSLDITVNPRDPVAF
ncbi:MAG: ACT domain-containing protein [Magnetococcales bacterium]|nr:ACT domain-containing protein [Magnetococcales bacterium]